MGNAKTALEEFRLAEKLAPKDPNAHFNLGEALARSGENNAALDELRVASSLSPGDAALTRLVRAVESALTPPESTIKVDVRQVLVPVVVTDRDGHHVAGLTQADFKVFEDGVEQKIAAFSVESSGLQQAVAAAPSPSTFVSPPPTAVQTPAPSPPPSSHTSVRRTYLIVIDTLHSAFNHFKAAQDALTKLFQDEHSADSQYVVMALGASTQIVLNTTSDSSAVLAAFENKRFQKIFLDGHQGGLDPEMERFRRDLVETRYACNYATDPPMQVKCQAGIARVNSEAQQIAELDRNLTIGFLRQFRGLVVQLARARDRRTIVFLSDGFQIEPGREAIALVNAYFPQASNCLVPPGVYCPPTTMLSTERMQDEFEPILKLAAASNITIDTIDSRGLYGQAGFDAASPGTPSIVDGAVGHVERDMASANGNTLAEIADATGGTAFHDSNNLLTGLQRAFADGRDYYTIAYVSPNASVDGKFRTITVQVRDRSAVVNAKRGYWAAAQ
jgi:VWFA-related protein